MMTIRQLVVVFVGGALCACTTRPSADGRSESARNCRLYAEVLEDLAHPVRPGGVNGQVFWNEHADFFMYPPSFDFKAVPGARRYRFSVIDDQHRVQTFEADSPTATLAPIWLKLPVGFVSVRCEGVDAAGRAIGLAGERTRFWKQAPFRPGTYPKAKRGYGEAAELLYDYVFSRPTTRYLLEHGEPDYSYSRNAYPAKMGSALIKAMISYAETNPSRAEEAMKIARLQADYLISVSQPKGTPLEAFPPTFMGDKLTAKKYAGENMVHYPAMAGDAYLALYKATKDSRYLEAAKGIGRTFLRLQGEDGTWCLKIREKDGAPVTSVRACPLSQMGFLMALYGETKDEAFRKAADRAYVYLEKGPLTTWNWDGQYEDREPTEKYVNLTMHPALTAAEYLLTRYPGDKSRLAQARELVRYCEDQFLCWEPPCRADGTGPRRTGEERIGVENDYLDWHLPGVLEQYQCYHPIDGGAARMIELYLKLYGATGSKLDFAKAHALADSIVNVQADDGCIPTHWNKSRFFDRDYDWINCMLMSGDVLALVQRYDDWLHLLGQDQEWD